jgi:serine O-acetyltransferase
MYNHISTNFFNDLIDSLYPIRLGITENQEWDVADLRAELITVLKSNYGIVLDPIVVANGFFNLIPELKVKLDEDVVAIYEGDPAAKSHTEIILTYPGFYAIAAYRIANTLHKLGVDLIPRIITEYAHGKTGIDIHPGASIGSSICIDHGTGIVIGETSVIGNNVKIYQGVTIGALSISRARNRSKRHPTIEDNVVIYAQATILGGKTNIGANSIIGGNVWLTESVLANSKVSYAPHIEHGIIKLEKAIA